MCFYYLNLLENPFFSLHLIFNNLRTTQMMKSKFYEDLSKEELLGTYLDIYYPQIFKDSPFKVERVWNAQQQRRGIDLLLKSEEDCFYVDEKAQLDYFNTSLPTFAFEISYLKRGNWRIGWLLDTTKVTHIYFLVTNICLLDKTDLSAGLMNIKITGIYRSKLIALLKRRGLTSKRIRFLEKNIRNNNVSGKIPIPELNSKKEGAFYFSKNNKKEQPINLVLKLSFLLKEEVGKVLFELKS